MATLVQVLVDSTAGLSRELAERWQVGVVPLYLTWGEQSYRDGIDLLPADFYAQLKQNRTNPKTAAPNVADFVAACQASLEAGYQNVLIVTVTPNLSATYQNACLAANEIGAKKIVVLDSGQGAGAQALIAAYAAHIAQQGAGLPEVVAAAQAGRKSAEVYMAVDTLKYLRRSGRINGAQALFGELIQMKPILTFNDHKLQVIAKLRTMRRAADWLLERLTQSAHMAKQVLVMYADTPKAAAEFADQIREMLPSVEIDMSPVSGVVGGHTGPGLLGLAVRRWPLM